MTFCHVQLVSGVRDLTPQLNKHLSFTLDLYISIALISLKLCLLLS